MKYLQEGIFFLRVEKIILDQINVILVYLSHLSFLVSSLKKHLDLKEPTVANKLDKLF